MPGRSYVSPVREKAAAEKRARTIETAASLLRKGQGTAGFSLEAVAKAAGITRLTVYNQFGSRRGLLEALMEDVAKRGGIATLAQVDVAANPDKALDDVIHIFCGFWASDTVVGNIFDAIAVDPDVSAALADRFESGRRVVASVVEALKPDETEAARRDFADLVYSLTFLPSYRSLSRGRTVEETRQLILTACRRILELAVER